MLSNVGVLRVGGDGEREGVCVHVYPCVVCVLFIFFPPPLCERRNKAVHQTLIFSVGLVSSLCSAGSVLL